MDGGAPEPPGVAGLVGRTVKTEQLHESGARLKTRHDLVGQVSDSS